MSNINTKLLIKNGCVYEFGLIKRLTSEEEDASIFSSGNLLDSIVPNNDIGFLFKINSGDGAAVKDLINEYTGNILGFESGKWI